MFSSEADIKSQARSTIFFVALSVAGIYVVYRRLLLPKPLPGIPYDREAAKKVFGDVTDLRTDPDGLAQWCGKKLARSGTPICQALMGPLETPVVIVADVGDVRERLMGRSEFDRSVYIIDRVPLLGRFHLNLKTTEEWRLARHWSKDLLTPQFMDGVANPAIELTTQRLIELWERKSRLAKGRAFDIDRDIKGLNIDIILAFYFGADMADSILAREVDHVRQLQDSDLVAEEHNSVTFPRAKLHDFCEGLIDISQKVANLYATPWPPKLAGWWTRYVSPHFRRYFAAKETFVRKIIAQAVQRSVKSQDPKRESGVDHMVWRENRAAERAGRKPKYGQQVFEDEVYGILVAGQHTTSAAVVWMMKFLGEYPEVQDRLREEVQEVLSEATRENRLPTANEVAGALKQLPYLRAVIEEMLRLRQAMLVPRDATCDTELLGCRIPKGTRVLLVCQGPDPSMLKTVDGKPVHAPRQYPGNGNKDMAAFDPERWLVRTESGRIAFDGTSYPQLAFGGGVRGCWGRKVADLEMQIVTAMLVWKFDFLPVEEPLTSHDANYDISYRPNKGYVNVRSRG